MATNITSTQLDFDNIKNRLKTFLAAKTEFADYDFEGSGLSNILDVLSYNTHFNGLIANMALNESFLHTAQLRSSLITHAEALGYNIRSKASSQVSFTASVNLSTISPRATSYSLPINSTIISTNEEGTFNFRTRELYTATDDGAGNYVFTDINGSTILNAFEGEIITKTFYVGPKTERRVYVVPDENIDTTTAIVKVFPSANSTTFQEYTDLSKAIKVDSNSQYYTLREAPNGKFELNFGDGVTFGKTPDSGSKIVVEYLRTEGAKGNDCKTFTTNVEVATRAIAIVPTSSSGGGGDKQSLESIRQLAPSAFATQQRLVTSEDYRATITANFPTVKDVSVWGGEDNIPIDYGKVYISLDYNPGLSQSAKSIIENRIKTDFSDNLSVMSITPQFIDPVVCYIEMVTEFYYNPDLTGKTGVTLENNIRSIIQTYFASDISGFGKTFRRSNLLTDIDAVDSAILNSKMDIKMQLRLTPTLNIGQNYSIVYPVKLATPDDVYYRIESSMFEYTGASGNCKIVNVLGSNVLKVVNISKNNETVVDNVGNYNSKTGTISLDNFNPTTILSGVNYIKFSATPDNQAILKSLRNFTFDFDSDKFVVSAQVDRENVRVSL